MNETVVYNSINIRVETPDGTMFAHIMENGEGKPCGVQVSIGKAGNAVAAWAQATAVLATKLLESGVALNDIIALLSELRGDKRVLSGTGLIPVRSGPDGLCTALMMYRKDKYKELEATLRGTDRRLPGLD